MANQFNIIYNDGDSANSIDNRKAKLYFGSVS